MKRRLERLEETTSAKRIIPVLYAWNLGLYFIEEVSTEKGLTREEFEAWKKTLPKNAELSIVESWDIGAVDGKGKRRAPRP